MSKKIKEALQAFALMVFGALIFTPLLIKACETEYEYNHAKSVQWQQDLKDGKPFTDFNK
jgi:hypothetical protein